jgi:hypothetical protein
MSINQVDKDEISGSKLNAIIREILFPTVCLFILEDEIKQ